MEAVIESAYLLQDFICHSKSIGLDRQSIEYATTSRHETAVANNQVVAPMGKTINIQYRIFRSWR
jgi:hypothetical protein